MLEGQEKLIKFADDLLKIITEGEVDFRSNSSPFKDFPHFPYISPNVPKGMEPYVDLVERKVDCGDQNFTFTAVEVGFFPTNYFRQITPLPSHIIYSTWMKNGVKHQVRRGGES